MVTGDAEGRAEMPGTRAEGSGRYPPEQAAGVSNATVKTDHSPEEKMGKLMRRWSNARTCGKRTHG